MLGTFQEEYTKIRNYVQGEYEKHIEKIKQQLKNSPTILFGAGFLSPVIWESLKERGIPVQCFCDNFKSGFEEISRLPILSPEDLRRQFLDANIILAVSHKSVQDSIYKQLLGMGFRKEQIFSFNVAYQLLKKSTVGIYPMHLELKEFEEHLEGYEWAYQFFDDIHSKKIILNRIRCYLTNEIFDSYLPEEEMYFIDEIPLSDQEVFVDGGMYTGDTIKSFLKKTNGVYKGIIGFDIDPANIQIAEQDLDNQKKITIYNKGLWKESGIMFASLGKKAGSSIHEKGTTQVELTTLDEIFMYRKDKEYPTFLKFDIEGAEQEALLGGKLLIEKRHPNLAVCVYHKPEDIYIIPKMLHDMNPLYRFRLEHYSPYIWDTVLYAF